MNAKTIRIAAVLAILFAIVVPARGQCEYVFINCYDASMLSCLPCEPGQYIGLADDWIAAPEVLWGEACYYCWNCGECPLTRLWSCIDV